MVKFVQVMEWQGQLMALDSDGKLWQWVGTGGGVNASGWAVHSQRPQV